jgi:type I restriction enzyme, R subunit
MLRMNEARTRKELIDPLLEAAGWNLHNHQMVGQEIPVDGYNKEPWNGITDYTLYRENGEVLAVVEAKRTIIHPGLAQQQAEHYVDQIALHQGYKPFAFMTNGIDIYFLDVGRTPKRMVHGFFTRADLERMLRFRTQGQPLSATPINNKITDRPYQHASIRRVCEAFDQGKRKALVVMATGTGKTRTAMSIIDLFMRARQAENILFVADRDALVTQAMTDGFVKNLPDEPCTRIYTHHIDTTSRLYAATLQTLSLCFQKFSPGFFDLIIFDEVHRSIFNKFNDVIEYFDGRMIGLTATPAQFITRDTFRVFDCFDGKPTALYTYKEAVDEQYLVDYNLYLALTRFQREGIHGRLLSEEDRNRIVEMGLDPDEFDYDPAELERTVSNRGMLRAQWEEFWEKCLKDQSGSLPGKTIVFAIDQKHALRLLDVFEEMYPQYPDLARVITCDTAYADRLIERFKTDPKLRIAMSVDMLDTGIDVPEVVNLVFMKPVGSRIKLDQMIGRGTRSNAACRYPFLLPNGVKSEFLILDFWENEFNRPPDEVEAQQLPVLVSIFNTRLKLLETYLNEQDSDEAKDVILDLRSMVSRIPRDSYTVKKALPEIEHAWEDGPWNYILPSFVDQLRLKVGPLLRMAPDVDVPAETFISKVERLRLALRSGRNPEALAQSVAEDAALMPPFVRQDTELGPLVEGCRPDRLVETPQLDLAKIGRRLAPQMKNKRKDGGTGITAIDLPDWIAYRGYIILHHRQEQVYVKEYRERVERHILNLVEKDPVLQCIARGEGVDDFQLLDLERVLRRELSEGEIELNLDNIHKAYGIKVESLLEFLRQVLDLDAIPGYTDLVLRLFGRFITAHTYNANQITFLKAVQNVFLQKRSLALEDFYRAPLTNFGADAVDRWFSPDEVDEILAFTGQLTIE